MGQKKYSSRIKSKEPISRKDKDMEIESCEVKHDIVFDIRTSLVMVI